MIDNIHRKAIEKTYSDTCTVTEYKKYTKTNKTKAFKEQEVYSDIPCRLSFSRVSAASENGTVTNIGQSVTLFLSPEYLINEGSKITVTHDGQTTIYKQSGKPAVYRTHQEVPLELYDDKA